MLPKKTFLIYELLVAVAIIALSSCGAEGEEVAETVEAETSETVTAFEVSGTPLPVFDDPDPALGMVAPSFVAPTFSGEHIEFTADGTARLYVFLAHWCPSCQAEITEMVTWLADNPVPDEVEVVAVATAIDSTRDNYPPSDWFETEGWPTRVVVDDESSSIAQSFALPAFPYSVAVNGDGEVLARTPGRVNESTFVGLLDQLDAS